jgi:superfamily I DNA and/or RNA helicase
MRHRLLWMHHKELGDDKSDGDSTSRTNSFEVNMVMSLRKDFTQKGVTPTDSAVLTPYLEQLRTLRKKLSSTYSNLLQDREVDELAKNTTGDGDDFCSHSNKDQTTLINRALNQAIPLARVDNLQSEKTKVFIVSLVRNNLKNNPGFLKTPGRINVLLSWAQHGMCILDNTITNERVPTWRDVTKVLRGDGNLRDALELCCPRH